MPSIAQATQASPGGTARRLPSRARGNRHPLRCYAGVMRPARRSWPSARHPAHKTWGEQTAEPGAARLASPEWQGERGQTGPLD